MNNNVIATALRAAAEATEQLDESGSKVLGHYYNGRRPVLLVDKPPVFLEGVSRWREPSGDGGFDRVMAAGYGAVQLEWRVHEAAPQEVAHAT